MLALVMLVSLVPTAFATDTSVEVYFSAFDGTVLIQMESSYTLGYDNYYIEGINQIYEKDCGTKSGWMYSVNGTFPNYGCSDYKLKNGDIVEWRTPVTWEKI